MPGEATSKAPARNALDGLSIAVEIGSVRVRDQLTRVRVQLEPWKDNWAVRELDEQMTLVR